MIDLNKVEDLFSLSSGDSVSKRSLFDLIQFSKVEGSSYWSGPDAIIGNTPQQGINWIGQPPDVRAVLVKTRSGSYAEDGWSDANNTSYHYSFKARKGVISYADKANKALINQPEYLYPVLVFTEKRNAWLFEGFFGVAQIAAKFVVLNRDAVNRAEHLVQPNNLQYYEGERKYITHLVTERSKGAVDALKNNQRWICDICSCDFHAQYGVKYIEAHHKVPVSIPSSAKFVTLSDFALLCPNCHKAVHIYMRQEKLDYVRIKDLLDRKLSAPSRSKQKTSPVQPSVRPSSKSSAL